MTVTNTRTAETVTVDANHAGEFLASMSAQGGDTLSIVVTNREGNSGPPGTKQVGNVIVSLTDTMQAVTVAGGELTARGTLLSLPDGTAGVSIDGTAGLVEGNQFVVRLPVDSSTTTLTLTVRDFSGVLSAVAFPMTVQTVPLPPAIVLRPTRPAGLIPLTTSFAYSSPALVAHVALDADGDGTTDADETTLDTFTFTYTQPGLYLPRLTVIDSDGNVSTAAGIVHAADPAVTDARLQPVWRGVKDALRTGDTSAAARFIHSDTRAQYATVWSVVPAPALANIDEIMTQVQLLEVTPATAQYDMRRDKNGQTFSFPVWFQLDQDGLWRLRTF